MGDAPQHALRKGQEAKQVGMMTKGKIQKLKDDIQRHETSSGQRRTSGGALGIVSGICFVAAPFTGGATALVGGGILAVGGVGVSAVEWKYSDESDALLKNVMDETKKFERAAFAFEQSVVDFFRNAAEAADDGSGAGAMKAASILSELVAVLGPSCLVTAEVGAAGANVFYIQGAQLVSSGKVVTTTAGKVLGVAGGALSIVLGGFELCEGVKKLRNADKSQYAKAVDKELEAINEILGKIERIMQALRRA